MSETPEHLSPISLEQLTEETLPSGDLSRALEHLDSCGHCSRELEAHRNLFAALSNLPRFAPSPAFAEQVMARVRVAPVEHPVIAWLRGLVPSTRRGWVLLGAFVSVPVASMLVATLLILIQPLVTPSILWQWLQLRTQSIVQGTLAGITEGVLSFGPWEMVAMAYSTLETVPTAAIFGVASAIAIGIPLSAWVLLRLTRAPSVGVTYAN